MWHLQSILRVISSANLVSDAIGKAKGADVAFNAAGVIRAVIKTGCTGVQTVYDIFFLGRLGFGVLFTTVITLLLVPNGYMILEGVHNLLDSGEGQG